MIFVNATWLKRLRLTFPSVYARIECRNGKHSGTTNTVKSNRGLHLDNLKQHRR